MKMMTCGKNQCVKSLSDSNTVYWGIVCHHSVYVNSSARISDGQPCEGGGGYGQSTHYIWQAQLGLTPPSWTSPWVTEFLTRCFCTIILWLGKMIKPFFYSRWYSPPFEPAKNIYNNWLHATMTASLDSFRPWLLFPKLPTKRHKIGRGCCLSPSLSAVWLGSLLLASSMWWSPPACWCSMNRQRWAKLL